MVARAKVAPRLLPARPVLHPRPRVEPSRGANREVKIRLMRSHRRAVEMWLTGGHGP